MAKVITDNQHYADIAAAIRAKNETETLYKPSEMASAILDIQGGSSFPLFDYSGEYSLVDDGKGNWRVKFTTSGKLVFHQTGSNSRAINVFLVAGGAGGAKDLGGGGGSGETKTITIIPELEKEYDIIIGAGGSMAASGGDTSAFNAYVSGGSPGAAYGSCKGGDGASGGGSGTGVDVNIYGGHGGSDGRDGESSGGKLAGTGKGTTTREFGTVVTNAYIVGTTDFLADWLSLTDGGSALTPAKGTIYSIMTVGNYWYKDYIWNGTTYEITDVAKVYAGGGGGGAEGSGKGGTGGAGGGGNGGGGSGVAGSAGQVNTGSGGGGGSGSSGAGGAGGSGIVVIRNAR